MKDLDHELDENLKAMENGTPAEQIVANLPAESAELRPLIHLAAAVREVPHPLPSADHTQTLKQQMAVAAREMRRGVTPEASRKRLNAWLLGSGLAALSLAFVCLFVAAIGTAGWLIGPPQARAATLKGVVGSVEVAPSAEGSDWQTVANGYHLRSGQLIRTGSDGFATLAFFDGSQTTVGPDSELTLARVDGDWGGVLEVKLDQLAGTTSHKIIPLRGERSEFVVNTPAGQASVRGTTFTVAVGANGQASFAVDSGKVVVSNVSESVSVMAGQATISQLNEAPETPVYQFSLSDELTAVDGDVWSMAGVSFRVTENTIILGDPQLGDYILARGRILEAGWVADFIQLSPQDDDLAYQFTGTVDSIDDESWVVNGVEVLVNEVSEVDDDIDVGDPVRVTYLLLDGGRWLALEIENLAFEVPSTPLPTIENCTGAEPQPKAQELAKEYNVPYPEIMSWFCQGFGFGEIDQAYELSQKTGIPVADIFKLRRNGLGWGEIKKRLEGLPTPTPTATPVITATATITATLAPTPTFTITLTSTPTLTVTVTPTPTPIPTEISNCTGADPQPKAQTLANQYGVPYEEIMGWFCQGFGFGEIDLAYSLSLESGKPVAEIFAMKSSGMGWGNIKKELTGEARNPKDDNPGKDKDKNKEKNKKKDNP